MPQINELLKEGQEILVQIAKEPMAKKGARITSHIALPGRFLVFMPTVNHTGVSRKIGSEEERQRLKRILLSEKGQGHGGFIVRTAASGASEDDLRAGRRDEAFLKLMRFEAARARAYYNESAPLLDLIHPRSKSSLLALISIYSGLLDRIEGQNYDVFTRRVRLSLFEKSWIVVRAMVG